MISAISKALEKRKDLFGWSVRSIETRGHQLYAIGGTTEAVRQVEDRHYTLDMFRTVPDAQGEPGIGKGTMTILPGEEIEPALDEAHLMAGLVCNPPYSLPEPAAIPGVPLVDERLAAAGGGVLLSLQADIQAEVDASPAVRLSAAEFFVEETFTRLVNSRGLEAEQRETGLYLEWTLIAEREGRRVERFGSLRRRRLDDLNLREAIGRQARQANDLLSAGPPPAYQGAVVLRGETLGSFMTARTLQFLASASAKHNGVTPWDVGEPVCVDEVNGDPLTLWADRRLPFGTLSNCFDAEGVSAGRHLLIEDHRLVSFVADAQYAAYLDAPLTGAFGNVDLAPGPTPEADLTAAPHVEVAAFSWFFPDMLTGDFASEIRLGYLVDAAGRRPFRGGMLVGNYLQALANVRLSSETGFFGDYRGPLAARFEGLAVSGAE